jgi:hypothetical protein
MHTVKIIAGGFALLAVCLAIGRWIGGPGPGAGVATAAKVFLPLWFIAAGVNMWVGVSKAGYSISEEAPVFAVVFAIPAAVAGLVWWKYSGT